jgi:hypothetical protein
MALWQWVRDRMAEIANNFPLREDVRAMLGRLFCVGHLRAVTTLLANAIS